MIRRIGHVDLEQFGRAPSGTAHVPTGACWRLTLGSRWGQNAEHVSGETDHDANDHEGDRNCLPATLTSRSAATAATVRPICTGVMRYRVSK